jgi:transposase
MELDYTSEDYLVDAYRERLLTIGEMAEECDATASTVRSWMDEHGIERRSPAESQKLRGTATGEDNHFWSESDRDDHTNPDWLRERYWEDGMSIRGIADEVGVSHGTVRHQMKQFDIERRDGPAKEGPHTDERWLRESYRDRLMSMAEMADEAGVSLTQIRYHMDEFGIERRTTGESLKRRDTFNGDGNPQWKGGYSDETGWRLGHEWLSTRREVLRRDDHTCRDCGGDGGVVHHSTPVSEDGAKYDADNLVTLCSDCHTEVHR